MKVVSYIISSLAIYADKIFPQENNILSFQNN